MSLLFFEYKSSITIPNETKGIKIITQVQFHVEDSCNITSRDYSAGSLIIQRICFLSTVKFILVASNIEIIIILCIFFTIARFKHFFSRK